MPCFDGVWGIIVSLLPLDPVLVHWFWLSKSLATQSRVTRFDVILKDFGSLKRVYLVFWEIFEPTLAKFDVIGLIFIVANAQISKT